MSIKPGVSVAEVVQPFTDIVLSSRNRVQFSLAMWECCSSQ